MSIRQRSRRRLRVGGIVQGVGFRPFVYGLATSLELAGFVYNDAAGVVIEVEGAEEALERFCAALVAQAPPLAAVDRVVQEEVPVQGAASFAIHASAPGGRLLAAVSPDVATCAECLAEISDPAARRHRYPFTNCTNCGPRFTITTGVPYDRATTTMAGFAMCDACRTEYDDPGDRRFHAQPIACPACGPQLRLLDRDGARLTGDSISAAGRMLREGLLLAVKGLGGYHIACHAADEGAVSELRRRKAREEKPLALMVADVDAARRLARVRRAEERALTSPRRPIVLVARREGAGVAPSVAPANRYLGVMLPYTPLHHLLLAEVGAPIVLTSGNASDEPIAYRDEDALERLRPIADAFVAHDRPIHVRCDDSVTRVVAGHDYLVRRARGYAPEPLRVEPGFERPVLGAGPELKHTFCIGTGARAILSHHIGDLEDWAAMSAFLEGVAHFRRLFDVDPEVVAHDLHPEYLATKWALELDGVDKVGVQHHHAHVAACLADNGRTERVIGLALDGTGWGDDGAIWGCEVLACDLRSYARLARLRYMAMPGGAMAIREPWRMAAVYLSAAFGERAATLELDVVERTRERWGPLLQMAEAGINSPSTSSAGRLFDAVAALCGLRTRVSYEGQAAAELEQTADPRVEWAYPCSLADGVMDGVELVAAVAEDLARGRPRPIVAAAFHNGLAGALAAACELARREHGLEVVALSGGTWQNLLLLQRVRRRLTEAGFEVVVHRRVPPNDGGISLGQAVVANARSRR